MTWTAHARVDTVAGSVARLVARAEERVPLSGADGITVPGVSSNTEGKIKAMTIAFEFDGPSPLKVGDVVSASGHFQAATQD